jgi:hypothetical protein
MRDLVTVHVPDLLHETRWPAYITAVAEQQGLGSILAVPLRVEGETRAALNLFSEDRHGSSGATIGSALSAAMRSRAAIGLATGVMMAQNRCGQDDWIVLTNCRSASGSNF